MARQGREGLRNLKPNFFVVREDENGSEYVSLFFNETTKNPSSKTEADKKQLRCFMYATPGDPNCPVASFKTYST